MRILLVTDAWFPQVNGVVRTLSTLKQRLEALGHEVLYITPEGFRSVPCPTYPEIRLALRPRPGIAEAFRRFRPCVVHIATEGPLGLAARAYCRRHGLPFTTAFHTKFPEYVHARTHIPVALTYRLVRWFHGPAQAMMVATQGIQDELEARGFTNIRRWTRGVDTDLFRPRGDGLDCPPALRDLPRPIFLNVGRVAVEKNISAFLDLDLPGSKVVVGDGPQMEPLSRRHPEVIFTGAKHGADLAAHFAAADVFVFPSLTDTFGLVLLEAVAAGTPVAAFPVPGPKDVFALQDPAAPVAILDADLGKAALAALELPRDRCRAYALANSWDVSVGQFLDNIAPFEPSEILTEKALAAG
jgi:glycosyltransferase involved in cell wall biosynthesis